MKIQRKKLCFFFWIALICGIFLGLWWVAFPLPDPFFQVSYSTVLLDKDKNILAATIAPDEQWRLPPVKGLPEKYKKALIAFEDKRFYSHPGIDPLALIRAIRDNIGQGKVVSGASTLSMQVIRLQRGLKPRTLQEKFIEANLALKLELCTTKDEILDLYANHAPFGGNIVGIGAASWRYFNIFPENLTWAEAALLAVLPNAPALIYPGKNQILLKKKRDRLLKKLHAKGEMDATQLELSLAEPLPGKPYPLPHVADHLLFRTQKEGKQGRVIHSSIDKNLQVLATETLNRHYPHYKARGLRNAAALIIELSTGRTVAYVGNVSDTSLPASEAGTHGWYVDMVASRRSVGSLLKPVLFAKALEKGTLLPGQMLADVPVFLGQYSFENFNHGYAGMVGGDTALVESLNIPFALLLRKYGYLRFYRDLPRMGFPLERRSDYYGLSLILGGAELSLWEMTAGFAGMGRTLLPEFSGKKTFFPNTYLMQADNTEQVEQGTISPAAVWATFEILKKRNRPGIHASWTNFENIADVAWKTGTSMGGKDVWSIGVTPAYVVGVWVGNADGEGRAGITGINTAAPILFDLLRTLDTSAWFSPPELTHVESCADTGFKASPICPVKKSIFGPQAGVRVPVCPYHKLIFLSQDEKYQVHSSYYPVHKMVKKPWLIFPPLHSVFFRKQNPRYQEPPPFLQPLQQNAGMEFLYPREDNITITIPTELTGTKGRAVFEVAHRKENISLFWHVNGKYLGETALFHQMELNLSPGSYELTVVDSDGDSLTRNFTVALSAAQKKK